MPKDAIFEAKIQVEAGKPIELPSGEFVANAAFVREGLDLHLTSPDGQEIVVEGYFAQNPAPDIVTADGAFLSPEMVDTFLPPEHVGQYAAANGGTAVDVSPAGQITELVGSATIIRADGTKVAVEVGTPVYPGDVIETSADGAVNILFADNTTFAISESARLSVDEFVYNAGEQEGSSFFSMLQGVFVYTSGLIGKNDPGNVNIETPVGSIGIRGTVVAGDINPAGQESTITIVDGAIVLTNQGGTLELNDSFETASLSSYSQEPTNIGQIDASTFSSSYQAVSTVASATFDSVSSGAYTSGNTAAASSEAVAQDSTDQKTTTDTVAGTADATTDATVDATTAATAETSDTVPVEATPESGTQTVEPAPSDSETLLQPPADSTTEPPPPTGTEPIFFMPPPPPPPSGDTTFTTDGKTTFGTTDTSGGTTSTTTTATGTAGTTTDGTTLTSTTTNILPPPPPPGGTTGAPVYNGPNLAPGGSSLNISATEDAPLHFAPHHFGFVDANGNKLAAVIIDSLPAAGVLQYFGAPVVLGQLPLTVPVTSLFDLTYAPPPNGFGINFASFAFRVMDDGGTANGGVDTDPTANVLTLNILPVNDAPSGTNNTLGMNEDGMRAFSPGDFGFTDVDGHGFAGIIISSLPANGDLRFGGTPVVVGQQIAVGQFGSLTFSPALNASGGAYASFSFKVVDTGGTLNGGINIDTTPNTITFNVSAVNDPPVLTANAGPGTPMIAYSSVATIITAGMLSGADVDTLPSGLIYTVTTAPMHGALERFNGTIWTGATTFTQADITAGKVRYVNDGLFGNPADAFQYQLSDGTTTLAAQTFNISIPQLNFEFSTAYTRGTPSPGDDGVPLFGMAPEWGPGTVVGQANLTDVTADHFELTYQKGAGIPVVLTTSGDVLGDAYSFAGLGTPASIVNNVPLFHFDATTGMVTLVNPLAANWSINGDFTFTLTAKNGGGDVIGGQNFVINMADFAGTVFLGSAGNDMSSDIGQGTGGLTLTSNQAAFMDDGNDRVSALGGTNNVIMMGNGNDLVLVSNASFGMVDGGGGAFDRLVLTGTGQTYDFGVMTSKAGNIEVLEVGGGGNEVYLTLQSIFEMTDASHTLTVKTNSVGQQANLHLDMDAFTVVAGAGNLNPLVAPGTVTGTGTVNDSGPVTLQATYNSSTITLIIEQGGTSDGIIVHNI